MLCSSAACFVCLCNALCVYVCESVVAGCLFVDPVCGVVSLLNQSTGRRRRRLDEGYQVRDGVGVAEKVAKVRIVNQSS